MLYFPAMEPQGLRVLTTINTMTLLLSDALLIRPITGLFFLFGLIPLLHVSAAARISSTAERFTFAFRISTCLYRPFSLFPLS